MRLNIQLFLLNIIIIFFFVNCKADLNDESSCSADPESTCLIPSRNNVSNPFMGVQSLFTKFYLKYANKIKSITKVKNERRDAEFVIQKDSGIEKINSSNYQMLINGTWLIQIYSPWCPYSFHFQRTWRKVVKDVKNINELIISGKLSLDNDEKTSESNDSENITKGEKLQEKEKQDKEELKIKKRLILKNLRFAVVDANESIDVAALLEVKGFPTIKMLHKGNVVTYTNSTTHDKLVEFAIEEWMNQEWYNRLPKTPSKLYQLQLKFSLFIYKIMYHLDINIFVPFKYLSFVLFIYLAYNINILGKIRYGLIHVRQYFSAFVPEILDIE